MRCGAAGCALLLGLGAAWTGSFAVFLHQAHRPAHAPRQADGIVVLTGGADRVETALQLLADDYAPLLLVSGVGRGTDLPELARRIRLSRDQATHVTLGRIATTTRGNAAETASWAHEHGIASLIVVTAGYHMPRALVEIGRALPEVALQPIPVQSPVLRNGLEFGTVRIMANEFDKYLAVRLGLSRMAERS